MSPRHVHSILIISHILNVFPYPLLITIFTNSSSSMIDQAPDSICQYAISRVRFSISFGCTCSLCSCLFMFTGIYFLTHQVLHGWCFLTALLCSFLVFVSLLDLEKLWDLLLCFNKVVFSLEVTGVLLEISRDIVSYIAISQEMYAGLI